VGFEPDMLSPRFYRPLPFPDGPLPLIWYLLPDSNRHAEAGVLKTPVYTIPPSRLCSNIVSRRGIEPLFADCKSVILTTRRTEHCYLIWYLEGDSNPQLLRERYLRPPCMPFHHRGIKFGASSWGRTRDSSFVDLCDFQFHQKSIIQKNFVRFISLWLLCWTHRFRVLHHRLSLHS
jgi:hypothetical protein